MNVVRLNQRNCGNTEHLSKGLFHSGLTADARHVVEELAEIDGISVIAVAGYSLGGNLALKLAGEYGSNPHPAVRACAAVSPILEISQCVRALERPGNLLYEWNFVRDLKRRIRRKDVFWPGVFDLSRLKRVRTVREFDEMFTAPHFGFRDAEDYYYRASAMRVIDRIRIPTLIITAADDPFVPADPFRDPRINGNPHIELHLCEHGGHCGFIGDRNGDDDGYWAESAIVDFVEARAGRAMTEASPPSASAGHQADEQTPAPSPLLRA
jgi:predicted alpha/beta-fold hydrolase